MKRLVISGLFFLAFSKGISAQPVSRKGAEAGPVDFALWSENMLFSDPEAALINLLEGYRRARETGDRRGIAYCDGSLASYWLSRGESGRVEKLLDSSRVYADSAHDTRLQIKNFRRNALLLSNLGKQNDAGKEIQKALNLLGAQKIPEEIKLCNAVAALINCRIFKKDKFPLARDYITKASKLSVPGLDGWVEMLYGDIEDSTGNKEAARKHFRQAISEMEKESNPPNTYLIIQGYYKLGHSFLENRQTDSAILWYSRLLETIYTPFTDTSRWQAHHAIVELNRKQSDSLLHAKESELQEFKSLTNNEKALKLADELIRKRWTLILLSGLALLSLSLVILVWKNRQRKKVNRLLEEQKSELQVALTELKNTQIQLVQREKMASLGELTAGIAHEIQNPLNFVNNFAEVNSELLEELQQDLGTNLTGPVADLIRSLQDNSEKIGFHGKRADSIVKGMLQHSRNKPENKESTDINNLVDECLRLSYHGMRAKEKDFNVKIETSFSEGLPGLMIVSQDIGRVLLNLFTNSFYSMLQRQKEKNKQDYQPVLKVTTHRQGDRVSIVVHDNGNGVPSAISSKIFQPFFTTKPPGEGTGLGLSLSYDIITKGHSGELKLQSVEGDYAEFSIILPIK